MNNRITNGIRNPTIRPKRNQRPMTPDEISILEMLNNPRNGNINIGNPIAGKRRMDIMVTTHTNRLIEQILSGLNRTIEDTGPVLSSLRTVRVNNLTNDDLYNYLYELKELGGYLIYLLNTLDNHLESIKFTITNQRVIQQLTNAREIAGIISRAIDHLENELLRRT